MGQITDLIPFLYHGTENEIIGFVEQFEPETYRIQEKIKGITALVNVDRCPDEFLPYLAAMTNVPIIGDNPSTWRKQIRNWPYLLKIKGTARSLEIFLDSLGITESAIRTYWRDSAGKYVEDKPEGEPYFDTITGLWRNSRTHYFGLELFWGLAVMPWYDWSQNLWERIAPWMERAKPFHSELLNVKLRTLFDFGDIIFSFPMRSQFRREYRRGRAVWSLLPRFDFVDADAIPLDWRPWRGYLRPLMTARTVGGLTGVSRLDGYLRFDNIDADVFPLDVTTPYAETDFPPILVAFLKRDRWRISSLIRAPTLSMSKQRHDVSFSARLTSEVERRIQALTATASPRYEPDRLDNLLSFDAIPADFMPLDMTMPHVESEAPPCARLLFFRDAREASAYVRNVQVSASIPVQRRNFYVSSRLVGSGITKVKISGRGYPPERMSYVDDFLSFDSTPADFVPLDNPIPHREGFLLWR
jgi:hypothetical protein